MAGDKNYLGLGVVFKAVDEGFSKSIKKVRSQLASVNDEINKIDVSLKSKSFTLDINQDSLNQINKSVNSIDLGASKNPLVSVPEAKEKTNASKNIFIKSNETFAKSKNASFSAKNVILNAKNVANNMKQKMASPFRQAQKKDTEDRNYKSKDRGYDPKFHTKQFIERLKENKILGKSTKMLLSSTTQNTVSMIKNISASVISGIPSIANALIGSGQVTDLGKSLDSIRTKMSLFMDPAQAESFNDNLIKMIANSGVTAAEVNEMTLSLNNFGVSTKTANQLLPVMGDLVGVLGLNMGDVSSVFGQATQQFHMTGEQVKTLTAEMYALGKNQGIPDLINYLPEIGQGVYDSLTRVGKVTPQTAKKVMDSTTLLVASYRKLGIGTKEAVSGAMKVQSTLTSMSNDIQRMKVGLEPKDFEGLMDTASAIQIATGKSAEDVMDMLTQSADNPKKFVDDILASTKDLGKQDLFRLAESMREKFGDEIANALKDPAARKAMDEASKTAMAAVKGPKAQDVMSEDIAKQKQTLKFKEEQLSANKALTTALAEVAAKEKILFSWNAQISQLQKLQSSILKQDIVGQILTQAEAFKAGGTAALFMSSAMAELGTNMKIVSEAARDFGGLFSALGSLGNILGNLLEGLLAFKAISMIGRVFSNIGFRAMKLVSMIKGIGSGIAEIGPKIAASGKYLKVFGKVALKFLGPLGAALGFIEDGMDAMKEKTASATAATLMLGKESKTTKDALKNAGAQALKYGALGGILGSFVPVVGTTIGAAIGAAIGGTASLFKSAIELNWFSNLKDVLVSKFSDAFNWLGNKWLSLTQWMGDKWTSISTSFGAFATNIWDGLKNSFSSFSGWIKSSWGSITSSLGDFSTNIWDGLKNSFISVKSFITNSWSNMWDNLKAIMMSVLDIMKIPFEKVLSGISFLQAKIMGKEQKPTEQVAQFPSNVQPLRNQPEASRVAKAGYKPTFEPKKENNTLDDVVSALVEIREIFISSIGELNNRPVVVTVAANAKGLISVVNNSNQDQLGAAGYANAVAGT